MRRARGLVPLALLVLLAARTMVPEQVVHGSVHRSAGRLRVHLWVVQPALVSIEGRAAVDGRGAPLRPALRHAVVQLLGRMCIAHRDAGSAAQSQQVFGALARPSPV
jgi:hypothetical protein